MRTTFMTMAALAALSVAAPATAQPWNGNRTQSGELQLQIDEGIRSGSISREEVTPLRESLSQLVRLERRFSANGISGVERALLQQRGAALRQQINFAERTGDGHSDHDRAAWEDRYDREHRADWESRYVRDRDAAWEGRDGFAGRSDMRFDRANRGDRFAGDARIGQRTTYRMAALPERYRTQFRDDDRVYYRHDDRRIYQVDRRTHLILGLLDMAD